MSVISISSPAFTAGSTGIVFTLSLSEAEQDAVTVNWRVLLDGTALDDDLFYALNGSNNNGTVTFAPGETTREIEIFARGDTLDEVDKHIVLELFDPAGAMLDGGAPVLRATGILLDGDGAGPNAALFVSDPVLVEGDAGQTNAVFDIDLSRSLASGFAATYTTIDGTALAGEDYEATSGTLQFVPGQQSASVSVPVFGDTVPEAAEWFSLAVTLPGSPAIDGTDAVGEALVLNDDPGPVPSVSIAGGAALEGEGIRFVVTLSQAHGDAVELNYRTRLDGTADDSDLFYDVLGSRNTGTLTFAPGETSKSVFVFGRSDNVDEADEHVLLELFDPVNATLAGGAPVVRATGVLLDDDGVGSDLALFVADPVLREGDGGQTLAVFEVELSRPAPVGFTATYATADGTALAGEDYVETTGTLTFAEGQRFAAVAVPVVGDANPENAETFSLVVTPPGTPSMEGTDRVGEALILDDDGRALPSVSIAGGAALEGEGLPFTITLSEPFGDTVEVSYRTLLDGTALDEDLFYTVTGNNSNGTLVFAPGETTKTVEISSRNDNVDEADEHVVLELFDPVNAVLSGGAPALRAAGVILDDDGSGSDLALFVSDPVLREGDAGQTLAVFEVELSGPAPAAFDLAYTTADGSAVAGDDYQATSGTLSFVEGQRVASVAVPVFGDTGAEVAQTFSLVLTPPATPALDATDAVGEATILDDDPGPLPVITATSVPGQESRGDARIVVTLSEPHGDQVTVDYRTRLDDTARDGDLFYGTEGNQSNGTLTFAPGETTKSVVIVPRNDSVDEADEHVTVEFFDPVNAMLAGGVPVLSAPAIFLDDEGAGSDVALFVSDPVLREGDAGEAVALFTLALSRPAPEGFTATYATRDGTAVAGEGYAETTGNVTFAAGQQVAAVAVPVFGDTAPEPSEGFSLIVTLPGAPPIDGTDAAGSALILDDDAAPAPTITVSGGVAEEGEPIRFVVTLSGPAPDGATVDFDLETGSAGANDVFYSLTGPQNANTLTFAPGETTKTVEIFTRNDSDDERDESLFLRLSNADGATLAGGSGAARAIGFILDDDGVGFERTVAGAPQAMLEPGTAPTTVHVPVHLSSPADALTEFDVTLVGVSATAGADLALVADTVSFAPGQTEAAIAVEIRNDDVIEPDETALLSLSPAAGTTFFGSIAPIELVIVDPSEPGQLISGDGGPNVLEGGGGPDALSGGGGDDRLVGRGDDDILDGGAGFDIAEYSGARSSYTVTLSPSGISIADRRGTGDGTDVLSSIESLAFLDQDWPLAIFSDVAALSEAAFRDFVEVYIAYFGRAPDAEGLFFYGTAFANGTSLEASAATFLNSPEYEATYPPGLSNLAFATTAYENVLGRDPDQGGLDFWVPLLDTGAVTRDFFIVKMLEGAKAPIPDDADPAFRAQKLIDQQYLEDKIDLGIYFAVTRGMSGVDDAASAMDLFDGSPASITAAKDAIDGFYADALDSESGEFLLPLVGVVDDPFAVA